jgi:uncharacterized protein (TIGR04222 family)
VTSLFDVWPLDIDSGPAFLLFYLVASVTLLSLARGTAALIGNAMDDTGGAPSSRPDAVAAGPYRVVGSGSRFAVGTIPRLEDAWAVAYLRGGLTGLRDALLVAAGAANWVVAVEGSDELRVARGPTAEDPVLETLRASLPEGRRPTADVLRAATSTANVVRPSLDALLRAEGLLLRKEVGMAKAACVLAATSLLLLVGVVRCARAETLRHPYTLLVVEMVVLTAVTLAMTRRLLFTRGRAARRYLAWLSDATASLQMDLMAGNPLAPHEAALCVGIAGLGSLSAAPIILPLMPIVSSSSGDGGGGGGCGGGGWGGGGGCGG